MIKPKYFTNRVSKAGFDIILDSHLINQKFQINHCTEKFLEIEKVHVINKLKEMANI